MLPHTESVIQNSMKSKKDFVSCKARYDCTKKVLSLLSFLLIFMTCACQTPKSKYENDSYPEYSKSESLELSIVDINLFSDVKKEILIEYLARSSRWHVFPLGDSIIAVQRKHHDPCIALMHPLPKSYSNREIPQLNDTFFEFTNEPYRSLNIDTFVASSPQGKVKINMRLGRNWSRDDTGNVTFDSSLVMGNKDGNILLRIFESSSDKSRKNTQSTLENINSELRQLLSKSISSNTDIDNVLPSASWITSTQKSISIKDNFMFGYSVTGFINPGKKGIVYLKLFREGSSKPFLSEQESTNAEYVGWSKDSNKQYNFCIGFNSLKEAYETGKKIPVEVQLWFKPTDGSPEQLIHTAKIFAQ
jgi:hypothetical protein